MSGIYTHFSGNGNGPPPDTVSALGRAVLGSIPTPDTSIEDLKKDGYHGYKEKRQSGKNVPCASFWKARTGSTRGRDEDGPGAGPWRGNLQGRRLARGKGGYHHGWRLRYRQSRSNRHGPGGRRHHNLL